MVQSPRIELAIYVGDKEYALYVWPAVPRVGDEIMCRRVEERREEHSIVNRPKVLDENGVLVVEAVCWGTSRNSRDGWSELRVSLFCKWRE